MLLCHTVERRSGERYPGAAPWFDYGHRWSGCTPTLTAARAWNAMPSASPGIRTARLRGRALSACLAYGRWISSAALWRGVAVMAPSPARSRWSSSRLQSHLFAGSVSVQSPADLVAFCVAVRQIRAPRSLEGCFRRRSIHGTCARLERSRLSGRPRAVPAGGDSPEATATSPFSGAALQAPASVLR
jgi:hypothetical protein